MPLRLCARAAQLAELSVQLRRLGERRLELLRELAALAAELKAQRRHLLLELGGARLGGTMPLLEQSHLGCDALRLRQAPRLLLRRQRRQPRGLLLRQSAKLRHR